MQLKVCALSKMLTEEIVGGKEFLKLTSCFEPPQDADEKNKICFKKGAL